MVKKTLDVDTFWNRVNYISSQNYFQDNYQANEFEMMLNSKINLIIQMHMSRFKADLASAITDSTIFNDYQPHIPENCPCCKLRAEDEARRDKLHHLPSESEES